MVVVHEVELLDEHPSRPPYLAHLQSSAAPPPLPLPQQQQHLHHSHPTRLHHHHGISQQQQLKLGGAGCGGASSLPRHHGQPPSAPYQDPTTEEDDDEDEDDDLPEYAEAGPPTGPPPGLALIDRHPYLCPASGSAHRRSLPNVGDACDTSSSVPLADKRSDRFTALSALFTLVSLVAYAADVGSDGAACYFLYLEGNLWWFGLTLAVTVVPAVTVNAFSLRWYMHDDRESRASAKELAGGAIAAPVHRPRMGPLGWAFRVLFHLAFLGPVVRYIDLLVYGLKSRSRDKRSRQRQQQWHLTPVRLEQPRSQQVDYYLLMIHEDRDTALLALLESFMQSAPQLVLQLYILCDRYGLRTHADTLTVAAQLGSVGSSLFELCWSLASYHRALRRSVPDKHNMSRLGSALQFFWRLGTVASRAGALALFASQYKYWLLPACIGHWGVMTVWVMHQGTRFCDSDAGRPRPCREYLFNMLIGAIYLFCFLNVKDEPTRYKYSAYYVIAFLENTALIVLWYFRADPALWYRLPLLIGVIGSFVVGILFMLIYYRFFHPNGRLPLYNPIARCC
ncbi:XK-related protein 6-like [Amblyomma americanum]